MRLHPIALLTGLLGLLLLSAADPAFAQPPPLFFDSGKGFELTRLPAVLEHQEIRRQLDTGLTTTFLLTVTTRDTGGRAMRGGARVQIRYELWDEVYQLSALGHDGRVVRADLDSFKALQDHWQELSLPVLPSGQRPRSTPKARIKVELGVIPFSRSEQQDTQRWFSDSIDRSGQGNAENAGRVSEERSETLGEVFNLLMATSIQRRAIMSFQWQVPVSRRPVAGVLSTKKKERP